MGVKNFLIDGVSCAGKTTVCDELQRRGYDVIHGDEALAYWGTSPTGEPMDGRADAPRAWLWDVEKVRALVADHTHAATFFCGGSRNTDRFIGLFDGVFVLTIDVETLNRRLAARPADAWGGTASEGEAFARFQHATNAGLPTNAIRIDATAPLAHVVDTILEHANAGVVGRTEESTMMESCSLCRADLEPIIVRYHLWSLILNYNQDLLGKCFLTLARHEEQITQLTAAEWSNLHDHIRSTTHMLARAFQPDHFNYVFLQKQDHHVHMHIIPRYAHTRTFAGLVFVDPGHPGHYVVDGPPNRLSAPVVAMLTQHLRQCMEQ